MMFPRPAILRPEELWRGTRNWIWLLYAVLLLAALPDFFVQYWFNQSLGFTTIFLTNLRMQLLLQLGYGLIVAAAIAVPMHLRETGPALRKASLHVGIWAGTFAGWLLAGEYQQFLLAQHGVPFRAVDPVFGHDIGFYVYVLPAARLLLLAVEGALLTAIGSEILARGVEARRRGELDLSAPISGISAVFATPSFNFLLYILGATAATHTFLSRYGLLFKNNEDSGVRLGADYVDITGIFSTLNLIYAAVAVEAGLTIACGVVLRRLWKSHRTGITGMRWRGPALTGAALFAFEASFFIAVVVRDHVAVRPNEPAIQRPYIERHIQSTVRGYRLDRVESKEWTPPETPLSAGRLVQSKTLSNAPFVPSWTSYLEEPPDIQHLERLRISESKLVFGPTLQIFSQQQQLRPYYKFTSVDGVRYEIDGGKKMYASAVRELPSRAFLGPKEWLRYWGSAALMFTHGMGLVMSPVNEVDDVGNPKYAVEGVPPKAENAALQHEPRIYFGEGAKDDYVLTNVRAIRELDHATEQFRKEFRFPDEIAAGIPVNSLFRRLIFAIYTKDVTAFLFSQYIDHASTRVQIRREPLLRARSIAPFLFLDSNTYAFIADRKVLWMINGLTTTSEYPYSFREVLGDKADERAVTKFPERTINYGEDSVKVTMDAFTGGIRFYKLTDDPIVSTWARIYPDLFTPAAEMPKPVRAQLTYPLQWFHVQFDDIYKRYHQRDPIEFYNVEDLWDDADETLGSIGRGLSGYGTGDQLTFSYEGYNALIDPADLPENARTGDPGRLQYVMMMPFTPEGARNLRAVILAYQDPEHYGKLVSLQIPQGSFVPGPEQIDAYIDNDQAVHQQVTMWIRHGSEVIRGSTLLLPVGGDLIYVEPIWVSSIQNAMPQLKLFAVRYHGLITSGMSLAEALAKQNKRPARPEWPSAAASVATTSFTPSTNP